ncbi:MAG TPA: hypothetical protein VF236_02600 [Gaiellaceae bacterium]
MKRWTALLVGLALLVPAVVYGSGGGFAGDNAGTDGWLLGGTAQLAQDPENPHNDVIRIRTDVAPFFGTVSRRVNTKVQDLDNMLEFKSWFQAPKTCIGGSPRFQLAIDLDGDGDSDGNAFGDTGINGSGTGCPPNTWLYEDLTGGDGVTGLGLAPSTGQPTPNEENEWALAQLGGPGVPGAGVPWSVAEAFLATFPLHKVCTVALVDDTFGAPGMTGTAYYDIISGYRATFEDRFDIAGRGFATGCGSDRGEEDDDDDDDHDRDGDHDDDDDKWDNDRRSQWGDD